MTGVFDQRQCKLGEGPLWHPTRKQLFWFDIIGKRLLTRENGTEREWQFSEHVSAAGWVDDATLLIASETGLHKFDIESGAQSLIVSLEADTPATRSNDGRADPWGGFWIGTMGKAAEPEAGAIYRFFQGKITRLYKDITITNAICFSPDRHYAYFADTVKSTIMKQSLDGEGWPKGMAEIFVDLSAEGLNPDGAVVDADGCLWNAQWGASRVARYGADGGFLAEISFPASQISCPAFGGENLTTLFATSARNGISDPAPEEGQTFHAPAPARGQTEHKVEL